MAVRMNSEMGGFKLLEEDAMEDRPCPAVKKFVSSILDRRDMKDQEVAASFRNLMEYRDSASSPSACSVATSSSVLDGDRLNSPPSPSSPTTVAGPVDDQRLPNELLDEICEDIGMKEGMELDFVEYLMEQDTNPQMYMTQEAISGTFTSASGSSILTPTGSASGSSNNGSDNKTLTVLNPAVTTTPNFLFKPNLTESDWLHPLPMSANHSSSSNSSESTTVKSTDNQSPANKRVHLSASADTSPGKGQPPAPSGFSQYNNYGGLLHNTNYHNFFKMPHPGPLMAKRSQSYPVGTPTSSPVQSTHSGSSQGSNSSCHSNCHSAFSRPQEFSTNPSSSCHPSNSSDVEENTASNPTNNNNNNNSKNNHCMSPKPIVSGISSRDFAKPGSPNQFQGQSHFSTQAGPVGAHDGSVFQRVDKQQQQQPPGHLGGGKSIQQYQHQQHNQQQRWISSSQGQANHNTTGPFFNKGMYPGGVYPTHHMHVNYHMGVGNVTHMPGPPGPHNPQIRTPVDSPLDQGYFSNESAGNCSNSSAPSPAFTTSSISSFSSISSMMPAEHSQKFSQKSALAQQQISGATGSRPSGQKSVHFADMPDGSPPAYAQSPGNASVDMKPSFKSENGTPVDCAFEVESNGQPKVMPSGKILPRFNHNMKSGVAPYTVPNNQGQVIGPDVSQGYDLNPRPSCALNTSGDRSSPGDTLQTYVSKSSQVNGSNGGAFYVDGNQNMMRMDSVHDYPLFPPPLISPQSGEFVSMHPDQSRYGMEQYSSMQHQPHSSHPLSSTESMPPLQPHPQLQSMQHHHQQQQPHPFSSCSHSSQGLDTDFSAPHQNNMQITNNIGGGYNMPLAMSTPVSNRSGPNPRMGNGYGNQGCPPAYEGSYGQPGMYPSQQSHGQSPVNQIMMANQQASSVHNSWGQGVGGPEDLRVQPHPNSGSMKESLQPPHSHTHMQPSPVPACGAAMGPGPMQDMGIMNSGMGPPHPHMDPHPEYGPCSGLPCAACKMAHAGTPAQHHHHLGPCSGPNCHTCKMNHQNGGPLPPVSLPHMGPCAGPGCPACKMNQASRPQMLSSQQKFIQHLIMDEGNSAYRSHPLFPLLRDLVIAEMNFDNPQFHYQQLLSLLPNDFHKLLQNFLHRNPPSGHYQTNQAVESVIMDSLRLAHSNLVDKIRHRQELEKMKANSSASLRSMEEFCQKFDHSVSGPMQGRPMPNGMGSVAYNNHMGGYHEGGYIQHGHLYRPMKDGPDMFGESAMNSTSPQSSKTESKKHPSLPKEAVAMMMEWLRNHKDNPYPNDDEKAMLIKQTGLSINQVNYWFTNARRRILPKWSQCKT